MPYRSKKQKAYFHANVGKKGITQAVVQEYDDSSVGLVLPEKVKKPINRTSFEDRKFIKVMKGRR